MDVFIGLACVMQVSQLGAIMYYHGRIMPELRRDRDALKKAKGRAKRGKGMPPGYTISQKEWEAEEKRRRMDYKHREDADHGWRREEDNRGRSTVRKASRMRRAEPAGSAGYGEVSAPRHAMP